MINCPGGVFVLSKPTGGQGRRVVPQVPFSSECVCVQLPSEQLWKRRELYQIIEMNYKIINNNNNNYEIIIIIMVILNIFETTVIFTVLTMYVSVMSL